MPFDWKEFFELARELANQVGSGYSAEAAQRSAVSRAYYAAFCWVRNYAERNFGFQRKGEAQDHKLLRDHLRQQGKNQLASQLNKLRA